MSSLEDLKKECVELMQSIPLTNFRKRSKMMDRNQCISELENVWLLGPECDDLNHPQWFNFALIINSTIVEQNLNHLPSLKAFFENEKTKISFAGLSLLKANSTIPKHRDFNEFQPIHFNIISNDDCILHLLEENKALPQTEGSVITFDDNQYHCVTNKSNKDRLLLYIAPNVTHTSVDLDQLPKPTP